MQAGDEGPDIDIRNVDTGELSGTLPLKGSVEGVLLSVAEILFYPDGKRFAVLLSAKDLNKSMVGLHEITPSGITELACKLYNNCRNFRRLFFHPERGTLLTGSEEFAVELDPDTLNILTVTEGPESPEPDTGGMPSVRLDEKGHILLAGDALLSFDGGMFVCGCSLRDRHPDSLLSDRQLELLRNAGAVL